MLQPPDRAVLIPVLLITSVVLAAWLGLAGPISNDWSGFWEWVYRWQTLLASLIALGAAYWAAKPVWNQARMVSGQAAIDLLEVIERDSAQIAIEIDAVSSLLKPLLDLDTCFIEMLEEDKPNNLRHALAE